MGQFGKSDRWASPIFFGPRYAGANLGHPSIPGLCYETRSMETIFWPVVRGLLQLLAPNYSLRSGLEEQLMRPWKVIAYSLFAASMLSGFSGAPAQVSVNIGVAPVCPYGYFDFAPYDCAPYGYYGPDWFVGGVFIGAGPWFHGPRGLDRKSVV